jgi:hypothetical protein
MPKRGNLWETHVGDSPSFAVTVCDENESPISGVYAGTEALKATVWEGETIAPIASVLTTAWTSGTAGTTSALINGATTAGMTPGFYQVLLELTYGGNLMPYYKGWLRLLPIGAAGSDPPTYCSLQDLIDKAGDWLPRMMQETTASNFLAERARARSWLDEIITSRSRVFAYRFDLAYALYYGSFPFGPVESPDSVVVGYLASDNLIVRDRTIEVVAYKALALICEKKISFDDRGDDYRKRAQWYHAKASQALRGYRCEIDTNNDGKTDIAFNLGVLTFR